ncbi:MAG TPA: helix-turn-helix transcriptional regulator [Fimbriimonadaceae bacterium]|nr:helix-turn-helix transcriptional regulator [Fimbriimonadaceae bacterium]
MSEATVSYGSGNVFADLVLPNPEERLGKAKLAVAIMDAIKSRGLTQTEAAKLLGIDQPKVSKIHRGRLSEFSTERLLGYLIHLGLDVDIVIHKSVTKDQRVGAINVAYM